MKNKLILIAAIATITPNMARAGLVATPGSTLGSYCYSDTFAQNVYAIKLFRCNGADNTYFDFYTSRGGGQCPTTYVNNDMAATFCYVGTSGNTIYHCDSTSGTGYIDACSYCPQRSVIQGDWVSIDNGRVQSTEKSYTYTSSATYTCTETLATSDTSYGCESGYYTDDKVRSATMTCTKCPSNALCGGKGNAVTFRCDNGYYRNGSGCTKCPTLEGKIPQDGDSTTGATSITECYIESDIPIADDTGFGMFIQDCYWKN